MYSKFEKLVGGKQRAANVLGLTATTYVKYRTGELKPKKYIEYSIVAHSLLSETKLKKLGELRSKFITYDQDVKPFVRDYITEISGGRYFVADSLIALEKRLILGPVKTARFLGLEYPRYNEMKKGTTTVWMNNIASIETHLLLSKKNLTLLKKSRPLKKVKEYANWV